jgi:hypothetical protein
MAQIFGVRQHQRRRGQRHRLLEKLDHGQPGLRVYGQSLVAPRYEKFSTFLRLALCVHRRQALGLHQGLDHRDALPQKLVIATDRLANFHGQLLNLPVDFPFFQQLALPLASGKRKLPGIKLQDARRLRLMEVVLHGGPQLAGWRTPQIGPAILTAFSLSPEHYTLHPLRYDLRKRKGHGLLQRVGKQYAYRLTPKPGRLATRFVRFHQRVCRPLAPSLFHHQPTPHPKAPAKIATAYHRADAAIQNLLDLLAA